MKSILVIFQVLLASMAFSQHWDIEELTALPEPISNNAVSEGFTPTGNYIYSFGGIDSTLLWSGIHLKNWRINTQTLGIEQLADLPDTLGKIAAGASRIDNIIYIIGGYHVFQNGNELSSNKVHRFDISTNQFINDGAEIPTPIDDHVQAVWNDSLIYVVTGWSNTGNVPEVQIYNPSLDEWAFATETPNNNNFKCFGASGEIIGDTIYYFGGAAGFGFGARSQLRKGAINPLDPTQITWSFHEPDPAINGYRTGACTSSESVHWIGGSSVTYNYNAIAYNGSGVVAPSERGVFYHPSSAQFGANTISGLPMDIRGVANESENVKYLIGGILDNQQVSNKVLKLNYTGSLAVNNRSSNRSNLVYPNPTDGIITIARSGFFELMDIHGKTIYANFHTLGESVSLVHLPVGIYIARLTKEEVASVQRILIQ